MKVSSSALKWNVFFLLIFLSFNAISAQGWFQTYPELYPSPEETGSSVREVAMFEGIVETKDKGFLTWGAYNYFDFANGDTITIRLTKTDLAGKVQWTNLYEQGVDPAFDNLGSFTMTRSFDGNDYLAIGKTMNNTPIFRGIQLDDDGSVLNTFEFSEQDLIDTTTTGTILYTTKIVNIVPSPDNTFIVLGSHYSPYFSPNPDDNFSWIAKINLEGNIIWSSILPNTFETPNWINEADIATLMMSGLDVSPTGEIFVAGLGDFQTYDFVNSTGLSMQFIFKYDTNGNQLWYNQRKTLGGNNFADVIAHPNGDVLVKGHQAGWSSVMARLSSAGDTIWAETNAIYYATQNSTEYIPVDFCLLEDGNIGLLEMQTPNLQSQDQNLRFVKKDIDNNYLSIGNSFLSSLYGSNLNNSGSNALPVGKAPNDIALIATSDNNMILAGQYSYSEGSLFTYDSAYPYIAKPSLGLDIPTVLLSGQLYLDTNNNCVYDAGELAVPNEIVNISSFATMTNSDGYWEVNLPISGDYTISSSFGQIYPADLWIANCEDSIELFVDTEGPDIGGLDFGFTTLYECPRLEVDLLAPFLRPGFTNNTALILFQNTGTLAEDSVSVYVTMDSIFSITPGSSSLPYVFDAASNTYEFYIGTVDLFEFGAIFFDITCPIDAVLGSTPCFTSFILPFDRCNLESPDWDGSQVDTRGVCEGDSIRFTIENIGDGDMQMSKEYAIYAENLLIQAEDFILDSGESIDIRKFATGATLRIMAEQSDNFPEPSLPSVVVEMCNATDNPSTMGLVNNNPLDDQAHYRDIECVTITGSYDPNDKRAVPSGLTDQNYVNTNIDLEYTIRFQNTGTDTAFNVFILDTLSEFLDINTFEAGAASHNYELSMLPGRVIRWDFPNILLPDSTTNLVGSNGALQFSIRAVQGIPQPTEIHNVAGIYFDFNEPVITEDMFVTVCDECLIQTLASDGVYFDGKVLLEGPYDGDGLMTNNLQDLIPMNQPFANFPYMYDGSEQLEQVPLNMVDWVLVEARSGTPATSGERSTMTVETQAAILLNDGSIRGLDGISGVRFTNLTSDTPYHFCIRHRNHLDILTATALFPTENMVYDFTTGTSQALGAAQLKWFGADAKAVMYSGDFNSDGVIQTTDYDVWSSQPAAIEVYDLPDANLDGVIQVSDYDKWFFNKAKVGNVEIGF